MTRKMRRGGLVSAVLALALTAAAPAANAAVQFNGGPIAVTATARNPILIESTGSGTTVNCTASTIRGTVQSNGTGTIARGDAMFGSCSIALLGTMTFTQLGDWSISANFVLTGSDITSAEATLSLPSGSGARLSSTGCTFDLSGTSISSQAVTTTTPPALVTVRTLPFSSLTLGLTVSNATGASCASSGIANNDQARISASYGLSTALVGTLVP